MGLWQREWWNHKFVLARNLQPRSACNQDLESRRDSQKLCHQRCGRKQVFKVLDAACPPGTILASNKCCPIKQVFKVIEEQQQVIVQFAEKIFQAIGR